MDKGVSPYSFFKFTGIPLLIKFFMISSLLYLHALIKSKYFLSKSLSFFFIIFN